MAANSPQAAAGGGLRRCHWDGAGQEGKTCRVSYTCLSLSWFGIDGDDERIYFSKIRNRGSDPDGGASGQRDWIFRRGEDRKSTRLNSSHAGTILVTGRRKIRGLTTAATLWASGCLGLAIGVGFYVASLAGTALIWGVNTLLQRVEEPFMDSARVILVYFELQDITAVRHFLDFARKRNIRVSDIELMKDEAESSLIGMTASLRLTKAMDHQILHEELENVEGVDFLEFM